MSHRPSSSSLRGVLFLTALALVFGPVPASAALTFTGTGITSDTSLTLDPTTSLIQGGVAADTLTLTGTVSGASPLVFEGATANDFELTFVVTDPTADRTITLPNVDGTVLTTGNLSSITATGTIASGTWAGTEIAVANGGTGATTAAGARTAFGLVPGTDVQAFDAGLLSIAGLTTAADTMIYTSASDTYATTNLSSFARTMLDDANAGAVRTTIGAGTGNGDLLAANNLSDVTAATARTNLGLAIGTNVQAYDAQLADIAALAVTDGNIIVGDGANWVAESGATARTSLGLGSIATQAANSVSISGGAITGITDITVADGGTGASTFTANGVLYGNTASALQVTAAGTSGQLLIANGSGTPVFVSLSGDATLTSTGALSIGADKITEAMLKAVDSATDEDLLTYESTTGDFEWHTLPQLGALSATLTDDVADALDIQESTNNYINIATSNAGASIAFGNATTNPSFGFLGTGAVTIAGSADGTDALKLTLGDILVADGDLDLSGGDFNVTLDSGDEVDVTKTAAAAATEEGLDLTFTAGAGDGGDVYSAIRVAATSADHALTNDKLYGLNLANLGSADAQGDEIALFVGTGWDKIFDTSGFDVTNTTGATTITGSADGTDALVLTAGDILVSNGDLDLSGGDFNVTLDAGDGVNIAKGAAPTTTVFTINGGTSATDDVLGLLVSMTIDDASGTIIAAGDPQFIDNNSDNAAEEWNAISTGDVTVTQNDSGGAVTGLATGIDIGTMTETATGNDGITSTALNIRNGWDRDVSFGEGAARLSYDEATSDIRLELTGNGSLFIEDTLGLGRQDKTITDDGVANDTLNPVNSYIELTQDGTANGGTPNLVIGTASTVQEGDIVVIVRIDSVAGDVTINESGALKQNGNITLNSGAFDSVMYIYDGNNYVQIGGSDNGA